MGGLEDDWESVLRESTAEERFGWEDLQFAMQIQYCALVVSLALRDHCCL